MSDILFAVIDPQWGEPSIIVETISPSKDMAKEISVSLKEHSLWSGADLESVPPRPGKWDNLFRQGYRVDEVHVTTNAALDAKDALIDRLRLEAQGHAMEARGANATIAEIYQAVTGKTGEPGSWNGAKPVIDALATTDATIAELREALEALVSLNDNHSPFLGEIGREIIDRAWDRARAALEATR